MRIRKIATRDFKTEILLHKAPLIVLFEADWCPFCTRFREMLNRRLGEIRMPIAAVLLNDYDDPLWDDCSIGAVPTFAVYEDGKVVFRIDGPIGVGLDDTDLSKLIDYVETRSSKP